MPRKPSSFFLIIEAAQRGGPPPLLTGQLTVQRIPLKGDETMEDKAPGYYHGQPAGTTVYMIEDTKVKARTVTLNHEEVDDPRLPDQPPDEEPPTP